MEMKSMKISKAEGERYDTALAERPEYPWGLCLTLDNGSLEKLGMEKLPEVGEEVMILAKARVTSVSSDEGVKGENKSVRLQITEMDLHDDEGEDDDAASALYGGA